MINGGTAENGCSAGGRSAGSAGSAGIVITLRTAPPVAVSVPQPDRRRQVFDADHNTCESVRLGWVVGWPQLEHHLVLVSQIDPLQQPAFGHAPEVEVVPEAAAEQVFGVETLLEHRSRRSPFRGDYGVVVEVPPPHVVSEELLTAIELPRADDFKGIVVQERDTAGPVIAISAAEGGHEDAAGPAVYRMRPRVPGLVGQLSRRGSYGPSPPGGRGGIRLGVEDEVRDERRPGAIR